jgi:hypothetical protein
MYGDDGIHILVIAAHMFIAFYFLTLQSAPLLMPRKLKKNKPSTIFTKDKPKLMPVECESHKKSRQFLLFILLF